MEKIYSKNLLKIVAFQSFWFTNYLFVTYFVVWTRRNDDIILNPSIYNDIFYWILKKLPFFDSAWSVISPIHPINSHQIVGRGWSIMFPHYKERLSQHLHCGLWRPSADVFDVTIAPIVMGDDYTKVDKKANSRSSSKARCKGRSSLS